MTRHRDSPTGTADPDRVTAAVSARFNLQHVAPPDAGAVDPDAVVPLDLNADLAATREAIARLRGVQVRPLVDRPVHPPT